MLSAVRFVRGYVRPPREVVEHEVDIATAGAAMPATLLLPPGRGPRPGWVVLHGITVPGRRHPALRRFARALAAAGNVVLVPEIRAWCELRIAPEWAESAIAAAAAHLAARPEVAPGGVALVGFSFGATQALITAARPELAAPIRSVVAFGGYCDLERTLRCMLTGEHEWSGRHYRLEPDPYGRWIAVGNYLADVPGYQGMDSVAAGALALAAEAGRRGVYAGDPVYDPLKAEIRARLAGSEREVWDLVAPPAAAPLPAGAGLLAAPLARAALRRDPGLDPRPLLPRLRGRVVLAHGREDRLVPFTETLRLRSELPPDARVHAAVTRLFTHSRGADVLRPWHMPREALRYLRLLSVALRA